MGLSVTVHTTSSSKMRVSINIRSLFRSEYADIKCDG